MVTVAGNSAGVTDAEAVCETRCSDRHAFSRGLLYYVPKGCEDSTVVDGGDCHYW